MQTKLRFQLSTLQFLQFLIWGSWFVTGGTYMQHTLGFSGVQVGMVYGTTAIAATVSPFLVGMLADRFFSVEKLLAALHVLGGVLLLSATFVQSFSGFYTLILLYVLCFLPTFSLSNALCFHHIPDTRRHFPGVRVWGTVSWVIMGIIISLLDIETQVLPFRIAAAASFVQSLYCLTLPPTPPSPNRPGNLLDTLRSPEVKELVRDRDLVVMIFAIALICIPSAYYYSFVNTFLNEMGVANAAAKMSVGQVTEGIFMVALPWFFLRLRLKTMIFLGLLAWGGRYGLFMLGIYYQSEAWMMAGIGLHGLAYIFSMLSAQIYLDNRVPSHLRSTGQGFYSLLTLGIGVFIGSFIAGQTVSAFTFDGGGTHNWYAIWLFPTCFGIAVAVAFWVLFKGRGKG